MGSRKRGLNVRTSRFACEQITLPLLPLRDVVVFPTW
jgi:hypothetical protein